MKTGKAKPLESITVDDAVEHPIWVWALDEAFLEGQDETWQKPVLGATDVTADMLRRYASVTITLEVHGDNLLVASGEYDCQSSALSALAIWHENQWKLVPKVPGLVFPLVFESVPAILGRKGVRFALAAPEDDRAMMLPNSHLPDAPQAKPEGGKYE